jgi:hypothetical protein
MEVAGHLKAMLAVLMGGRLAEIFMGDHHRRRQ